MALSSCDNLTRRQAVCGIAAAGISGALTLAGCNSASSDATADDNPPSSGREANDSPDDNGEKAADTGGGSEPTSDATPTQTTAEKLLASMTLEQKVAQLFFVRPEGLTGVDVATVAGSLTKEGLAKIPVGGIVYFGKNITGNQQLRDLLAGTVELSRGAGAGIPVFTGVDEEGGTVVARVANSGYFDVEKFSDMATIGASGDPTQAAYVGTSIGSYLHDIGFSVDFAPDADVLTNPDNKVIGVRSFGSDPNVVSQMVAAEVAAMLQTATLPCAKHFPGHGDTEGDSHTGEAISNRTADQLESCEYLPFSAAIEAGCPFVMVGHIKTPNAAADDLPATLSEYMIGEVLRGKLSFEGVVISDAMEMGAISQNYSQTDAAVKFLQAGGDMILMPDDLANTFAGVVAAVQAGTISEERINESVARIIAAKQVAGLVEA